MLPLWRHFWDKSNGIQRNQPTLVDIHVFVFAKKKYLMLAVTFGYFRFFCSFFPLLCWFWCRRCSVSFGFLFAFGALWFPQVPFRLAASVFLRQSGHEAAILFFNYFRTISTVRFGVFLGFAKYFKKHWTGDIDNIGPTTVRIGFVGVEMSNRFSLAVDLQE